MAKKATVLLGASAATAALVYLLWQPDGGTPITASADEVPHPTQAPVQAATEQAQTEKPAEQQQQWQSDEQRDAFFIADMQSRFAPFIHIQHAQIRFIEQLISYLKAQYPDDWRDRISQFIQRGFPELAADLFHKFESLERYNQWLLADRKALQEMPAAERREALWNQRYAAFGEDAEKIWAAEIRNQKIADTLTDIDHMEGADLQQKLDTLVTAVQSSYGEQSARFMQSRQTELLNKFVGLPSVQSQLQQMEPEVRRKEMRQLRAKIGMQEDALDRWEALDEHRDAAWQQGQNYMAQREEILAQKSGATRETALLALQQKTFGNEAETIRREEAAGFFRYAGDRQIGRE